MTMAAGTSGSSRGNGDPINGEAATALTVKAVGSGGGGSNQISPRTL